jgi:hypothetical protein
MSRILVGEMAGADEDFGLEIGKMWLIFVRIPQLLIQLSKFHMGQTMISFQNHQLSSFGYIRT